MKKLGLKLYLSVLILLIPKICFAWTSWNPTDNTSHYKLANDAIQSLSQNDYPDLYRFSAELRSGSESEAPHPDDKYNGGNARSWWEDVALPSYNAVMFFQAYRQLGEVAHLTQDQGIPAHAANIKHGPFNLHLDKFELYAEREYVSNPSNGYSPDNDDPYEYYQPLQDTTRQSLTSWTQPSTGQRYWIAAASAPPVPPGGVDITGGDNPPPLENLDDWGIYGGTGFFKDIYMDWWFDTESPQISDNQIYQATRATSGVFAAASRKLPPLVSSLDISPVSVISPLLDLNNGNTISISILENRKQTVKIFITVDSPSGPAIIDSSYGTGKTFNLSAGAPGTLPWEGTYSVNWNGRLADGSYPSEGQHSLYVRIQDEDGNLSTDVKHLFTIDSTPKLTINKTGNGTVTGSGINCGSDCSESYSKGTTVTLTATPDSGWSFTSWSGGGCSGTGTCQVAMNSDTATTATFTKSMTWFIETADSSLSPMIDFISMATDSYGDAHFAYSKNGLKYATNIYGYWTVEPIDNTEADFISIAIDSNDSVHICYYDFFNGKLKYATDSPGYWLIQTVDTGEYVGLYTSIAVDSSNKAHISYYDSTTNDLKYANNSSGPWSKLPVATAGDVGMWSSIAVDSNNKVHFSYYDATNGDLKYATNAGGWQAWTVDSSGNVGGHTSVAIDSLNKAHISYRDYTNADLKYATNASGSWLTQTPDSYGDVGLFTSIDIDSSDKAHISYEDYTNTSLKYATNASGTWGNQTVESSGDAGRSSSISVDTSDTVHIGYFNGTNDSLKYAKMNSSGPDKYTLIINKWGTGSGTVSGSPSGINCGSNCRESYDAGTMITLSASPDANSTFTGWDLGCSGTGTCVVTLNATTNLIAYFASKTYTISAVFNGGGIISPPGATVTYGSDKPIAIVPDTGYHIADVLVNGSSVGAVPAYTFTNVTSNQTIQAIFALNTYTLGAVADSNGSISPSGVVTVNHGGSRTFTITPNTGYDIFDVYVDGVWVGWDPTYTFTNVTADHLIEAYFEIMYYYITATAGPNGSISPSGDLDVDYGSDQTFTITPNSGFRIADVLVDGLSVGAVSAYTFTNVTADHAIDASFEADTYILSVSKSGTGTGTITSSPSGINCGSDCSEDYDADTVITLTAAPDAGSFFAGWTGGGCSGTGTCQVTMNTAKNITAAFNLLSQNQSPVSNPGGPYSGTIGQTITLNGSASYDLDGTITLYEWDVDNNETYDYSSSSPTQTHAYIQNGTYTVKLRVTDNLGATGVDVTTANISGCSPVVRIVGDPTAYTSLQSAYNAAASGAVMQARDVTLTESPNLNLSKTVTINGGFNCDYTSVSGNTTVNGNMTINSGAATVENLIVQ